MAIGDHVKKYLAQKEAKAQAEAEVEVEVPAEAPAAPPSTTDLLAQMVALLAEMRQGGAAPVGEKERLALEAERLLLEQERVKREMPENKQAPLIGVYSRPAGERDDPKPPLKCKMFWVGYELRADTLTPQEIDLLNRLEPGEFRVTKADGTQIPFKVGAKHNDRFQLEALDVWFPCKGDHRQNHGSMVGYLQQALGERVPTTAELQTELEHLRAELAAARMSAA